MSELEVFWGSGSQPSWRVLLALEVKGLPYKSHLISFSAGEHKTPEFLRMNPRHRVPVFIAGYAVNGLLWLWLAINLAWHALGSS